MGVLSGIGSRIGLGTGSAVDSGVACGELACPESIEGIESGSDVTEGVGTLSEVCSAVDSEICSGIKSGVNCGVCSEVGSRSSEARLVSSDETAGVIDGEACGEEFD